MRIEKIYVEAKKSKNFQTYTLGMEIMLDGKDEDAILEAKRGQALVRKLVMEELSKDEIRKER